jgi:dihydrofolate synthase/folylpolyglutamate synthase
MDFKETVAYLYQMLPMYQRSGKIAFKKDLANTVALCQYLGDPQFRFPSVHIAGTNGKGSSAHMIASVLQEAGYQTALYTSPHIWHFTERIRINGKMISEDYVVDFVRGMRQIIEKIEPSFFELTVAMAFKYFADLQVDIAVVEVGLGGRLDSTNIIAPEVCLITNISYDHMDMLGDTLPQIAAEKAGIIKPGIPCVIGERQQEVAHVFQQKATAVDAPLYFAEDEILCTLLHEGAFHNEFQVKWVTSGITSTVSTDMTGHYQARNLPGVLKTLEVLTGCGYIVQPESLRAGLSRVRSNTALRGRFEVLGRSPLIICDVAHNEAGISVLFRHLQHVPYKKMFVLWAMVKDKDIKKLLGLLHPEAFYYFCEASIPRAMPAEVLWDTGRQLGLQGVVEKDVNRALEKARAAASSEDLILIGGSNFILAELSLPDVF